MPLEDHEKNRVAWNEMAGVHYRHPDYKVKEFLAGASTLHPIELRELGEVRGKSLLHLFCQFGLDTLSWARMGAQVTGVDISDTSIEYAINLAKKANLPAKFIRSDVLELEGKLDGQYDIVFQSYGTHCWISDLERWAEVVAGHLKPGGIFYIVDFHPVGIVSTDAEVSYFNRGPYRYTDQPDYCDKSYIIQSELVEWQHKLSDIVNAFVKAGFAIESLNEFEGCVDVRAVGWVEKDGYYYPPEGFSRYPMTFSLKAKKS